MRGLASTSDGESLASAGHEGTAARHSHDEELSHEPGHVPVGHHAQREVRGVAGTQRVDSIPALLPHCDSAVEDVNDLILPEDDLEFACGALPQAARQAPVP